MLYLNKINSLLNSIFQKYLQKNKQLQLGRWNIENCKKRIDKKIDFSNEDHCGPCGNNLLTKNLHRYELKIKNK